MTNPKNNRKVVHFDFETRSKAPFGRRADAVTGYQYARDPSTEVLSLCYAIDDEPIKRWHKGCGEDFPAKALTDLLNEGAIFCAHNADFEWNIWNGVLVRLYNMPPISMEQMDCTAARAAILAIPRSLEDAAREMGLPVQKDLVGSRLMRKMSAPRKPTAAERKKYGSAVESMTFWAESLENLERLTDYCSVDVETERELSKVLPEMTDKDRGDWLLTHKLNMHGLYLDGVFIERAGWLLADVSDAFNNELSEVTNGAVTSFTQIEPMREFVETLARRPVESLDKASVEKLLTDKNLPDAARKVLSIRQEAGKSSVAKLKRFDTLIHTDGVMRENVVFCGANTGRLTARGAQIQNLPSRGVLEKENADAFIEATNELNSPEDVSWFKDFVGVTYGDVTHCVSSALRGVIKSRPGKKLFVSDFSNIEGRVVAWLGGEAWKLDAFRAYDAGTGHDLYKVTAAGLMGCDPSQIDKTMRNILGKITELAFGFGGGVGAYANFAGNFGIDMADHYEAITKSVGPAVVSQALKNYESFGKTQATSMSKEAWIASECAKIAWRAKHKGVVKCWYDAEACVLESFKRPGTWFSFAAGRCMIKYDHIGGVPFLFYKLPSGRVIYKPKAELKMKAKFGKNAPSPYFLGQNAKTKKYEMQSTYSGDIFQSFVQATARDIMYHAWANLERAGFDVVLSVHDELGAEGDPSRTIEEFDAIMKSTPDWAAGLPVNCEGFVSERYGK